MDEQTKQLIGQLEQRIETLEAKLSGRTADQEFFEKIRDIVLVDIDNYTTRTTTAVDSRGDTVTVGRTPDTYLRLYFRGRIYNVGVFNLT